VTPDERAARDRLARYAGPDAPPFPAVNPPPGITHLTVAEANRMVAQIAAGIRDTLAPDLHLVLAALDRYETVEESVLQSARQVADAAGLFGPIPDRVEITYQVASRECEGCGCCNAAGCHRGPGSTCPSNSIGDSVCPCTED
jgi:hypothetical protein